MPARIVHNAFVIYNLYSPFWQLYVHGYDLESLYKHVPKRFLPTEYGGEAGTIQSLVDYWENKLLDSRATLAEWEEYGTNELLRSGTPVTEESILASGEKNGMSNMF